MIKTFGIGPDVRTERLSKTASRRPVAGGTFAGLLLQADEAGASDAPPPATPLALTPFLDLDALAADPDQTPRGRSQRFALGLLDRLDGLHLDILAGRVAPARLAALASSLRADRSASGDPRLEQLIDSIVLRAEVELAKLERS